MNVQPCLPLSLRLAFFGLPVAFVGLLLLIAEAVLNHPDVRPTTTVIEWAVSLIFAGLMWGLGCLIVALFGVFWGKWGR